MDPVVIASLAVGLSLVMAFAWAVQRRTGASGWIDTIWSFGVGLGGIVAASLADGDEMRRAAIGLIVLVWSIRLGAHIAARTRGAGEDPRYEKLLAEWGDAAASRLFVFLQIQSLAAFVLVLAIYLAASASTGFPRFIDLVAIAIALGAIVGEAVADAQLARFRKSIRARTEICETGLWRYSRHPNYFFEWLFWCAWPLFAVTLQSGWTWLSLLAPIQMYWLLVHVSGIPPLEQHMLRSRGDRFCDLQSRVNAFFPGPPKRRTP